MIDVKQLETAYQRAFRDLMAERNSAGHWVGQLSSSSLSTATAISALAIANQTRSPAPTERECDRDLDLDLVRRGIAWLVRAQNPDGGWGDTDQSYSNIATSMLVVAAFHLSGQAEHHANVLARGSDYVEKCGSVTGLRQRFGKDKTFAVPILTNCALAGLVPWHDIPALPFELACIPQSLYRWASLPVVSYAIPALVAIGQAHFVHDPPRWGPMRWIRSASVERSLTVLRRMQPESGGYLEAAPLTSFVVMSLASTGRRTHPVTKAGLRFLRDSVRADGSWPIDTNLATWTTTLALGAMEHHDCIETTCLSASAGPTYELKTVDEETTSAQVQNTSGGLETGTLSPDTLRWLLACQHTVRHPFSGAAPGGWGWTDLSGAVPDADDTAGALLALSVWRRRSRTKSPTSWEFDRNRIEQAAAEGVRWLLNIQNADGGWPTFCRGWGKLPFDRSGADLTAHALRALHAWQFPDDPSSQLPGIRPRRVRSAMKRGLRSLQRAQHSDGSWVPLWFGNQDQPSEQNPVYGTSRVLLALSCLGQLETQASQRGYRWLAEAQNDDGTWSGGIARNETGQESMGRNPAPSSVEETAMAVEALVAGPNDPHLCAAQDRGLSWLIAAVADNRHQESSPIGFYFAKLWYYERLYPLVFSVAALGRAIQQLENQRLEKAE